MNQVLQAFRKVVARHQGQKEDFYSHLLEVLIEEDDRPLGRAEKYILAWLALLGPSDRYPLAWNWATHTTVRGGSSFREHQEAWNVAYDEGVKACHSLLDAGLISLNQTSYSLPEGT